MFCAIRLYVLCIGFFLFLHALPGVTCALKSGPVDTYEDSLPYKHLIPPPLANAPDDHFSEEEQRRLHDGAHQLAATSLIADFSAFFRGVPLSFEQGAVDGASEFETWLRLMAQAYQETATPFPGPFILQVWSTLGMGRNRPITEETAGQLESLFERLEAQRHMMLTALEGEHLARFGGLAESHEEPNDGKEDSFGDGRGNQKRSRRSQRLAGGSGQSADDAQ